LFRIVDFKKVFIICSDKLDYKKNSGLSDSWAAAGSSSKNFLLLPGWQVLGLDQVALDTIHLLLPLNL